MKIFDLHNDALTGGGKADGGDIIYAIWTSKLTLEKVINIAEDNKNKMLAIEDCGVFLNNFSALTLYGFKYVGLTWNSFNGLAGGAYSTERLTDKGRELISVLNSSQIVVDAAHLNEDSFFDVATAADKIICSHTCFYEVNNHPRNLTRRQISAIIEKGGIVGLCFVTDFLGGNSVDDVLNHVDWFLDAFGDKNISIGADFFGTVNLPDKIKSYENFDRLILAMIRRGYSDSTIHNVLYGNAAAYFYKS